MLGKRISLIIGSLFILALLSSSILSASSNFYVTSALEQNSQGSLTLFSVRLLPPAVANIEEGKTASYKVQVARGNEAGQFLVALSTASGTAALDKLRTFSPSYIMNFEEGERVKNATLIVQTASSLEPGTYKFQIRAAVAARTAIDQGATETATLVISDSSDAKKLQSQSGQQQPNSVANDNNAKDQTGPDSSTQPTPPPPPKPSIPTKPNHPPVAKAGQDKIVNAGERVILDASASTDPDTSTGGQRLSYLWEQTSSNDQSLDIEQPSANSPKAKFQAPQVKADTTFTIKLTVQDGSGGQASDYVNIIVKKAAEDGEEQVTTPPQPQPQPQDQVPPKQDEQKEGGGEEQGKTINRPPTAQAAAPEVSTEENKPISISLQGNDPDKDDNIAFVIVSGPSHATIAGFDKITGSLTYIPNAGFTGKDSIKYKVIDGSGAESNEASVVINVESVEEEQTTSVANVSSLLAEDRLNERQEIVESKLKETRGEQIANQYIVVLKEDSPATEAQNLANDAKARGAKVLQQYQKALKGFTINIPNRETLDAILNSSDVAYAEPDVIVKAFVQTIPTGIDRVDGELSSAVSGDGKGDTVNADIAILDTGIDLSHSDLNVYKHVTFVPGTTTGNDDNGHGTQVAGIAAAKDNDIGVVGVAPGARLWSVKVLDSTGTGSLSTVIQGIDYMTQHASEIDVADMSFGCEDCNSQSLNTAISSAISAGVTMVAAAGNGGKDASTFSPGNHPDVIAVSAIADTDGKCGATGGVGDDKFATFSNYGSAIDMAAPGVNIHSTSKNGGYSSATGTSMAAPHIAGAAALYKSEHSGASPSQVLSALKSSSSTASTSCNVDANNGYFTGDKDSISEPLLNIKASSTTGTAPSTVPSTVSNDTNTGSQVTGNETAPSNNNGTAAANNMTSPDDNDNQTAKVNIAAQTWYFIQKFGEGILNIPTGVAVNPATGVTYVADHGNSRIAVFNAAGEFSGSFGSFGAIGASGPYDVAFGPNNILYVTSPSDASVYAFTPEGVLLLRNSVGSSGITDPRGIGWTFGPTSGFLYVADSVNNRVAAFHPSGPNLNFVGFVSGSFSLPFDVACCLQPPNPIGGMHPIQAYATEFDRSSIQSFDSPPPFTQRNEFSNVLAIPEPRGLDVLFNNPSEQYIIVASTDCCSNPTNSRIQSFAVNGPDTITLDATIAGPGSGNGQVDQPTGVGVSSASKNVYVADTGNNRIQVFSTTPPVNQAPVAISESISTNEDTAKSFILNATDANGDSLSYLVEDAPDKGVLSAQNGSIGSQLTYTPNPNYNGPDSFTWKANDGQADSNIATISISVSSVNDVPIAFSDAITTNEDTAKSVELDDYAFDDNAPLEYSIVSNVTQGTITLHDSSTGNLTYTPNPNYNGPDSFTWKANDGQVDSNVATMDISVTAVNDAPVANDDRYSVFQDSGPTTLAVGQNDSDAELDQFSDSICIDSTTDPPNGSVEIAQACGGNLMTIRYTADPGFVGTDTFNYTITDGESPPKFDTAQVTIDVVDNVPPTPPVLLYPPHGGSINDNTPTFDWENSNDSSPVYYNLTVDAFSSERFISENLTASEFTPTQELPDSGYNWRVIPFDSNGNGGIGYNSVDNFGVDTTPPDAPVISSPTNLSSTQNTWVVLDGTAEQPGVNGFDTVHVVRVYDNVSGPASIGNVTMDGSTFDTWSLNVTGLADGPHSFTATVTDRANNTSTSSAATIVTVDTTAPAVVSTDPSSSATDVSADSNVTATFDDSIDVATITSSTFSLIDNSNNNTVNSQVGLVSDGTLRTAILNPDSNLTDSRIYTATLKGGTGGVKNTVGNPLAADYSWSFTTGSSDTIPPTITNTDPTPSQTAVSITPCVCITFSEQMSNATINTTTVTLKEPDDDLVTAQVSYDPINNITSFNPSTPLSYSTVYTATVKGGAGGVEDAAGNPLASDHVWSFTTMDQPPSSTDSHPFIGRWGALGAGSGQFNNPHYLDVDSAGNIYVADSSNNRVQKFRSDGIFITKWGSQGMGNGQFQGPHGVAVDSADNVYITDVSNNRVQKFTSSGTFITKWGTFGTSDGQFRSPRDLAVDSAGNIYVTDFNNQRVQKFTSSGAFITKWGTFGTSDSQFKSPRDLAVDSADNIYVIDFLNARVQKFTSSGAFITKWGTFGPADGQFNGPKGIGVDSANNVYVTDDNTRVQKFTSNGAFITKWSTGTQFTEPRGIGIDTGDNIYVADRANRVQKFTSNGAFITKWGTTGSGDGQFNGATGIVVNSAGNIYVTDIGIDRVQVFGPDTISPEVVSTEPTDGETGVLISSSINATFSEVVDNSTVNNETFTLRTGGPSGNSTSNSTIAFIEVEGIVTLNPDGKTATFEPSSELNPNSQYTATIRGGSLGVQDIAGNSLAADHSWSFTTAVPASNSTITILAVNNTSPIWGVDTVDISGNTSGSSAGDYVIVDWDDNSTSNSTLSGSGTWNATHMYNASAIGQRQVEANLTSSSGTIKATDTEQLLVRKHITAISVRVPEAVVANTTFTAAGYLTDLSLPNSPVELSGEEISFNGSGASSLQSVMTQGVQFIAPSGAESSSISISSCSDCPSDLRDGSLGNKVLRLPEGGEIILPERTFSIRLTFADMGTDPFALDIVLANGTTIQFTDVLGYLDKTSAKVPISKIVVVSSPVGYAGIASFSTSDFHGFPQEQQQISFENFNTINTPLTSPFIVNGSSFYSIGRASTTAPETYQVQAVFAGNDTFEAVASGPVSYETQETSPGQGASGDESVFVSDVGTTFNNPPEFTNLCANLATGAGDTDADGICDAWEVGNTLTPAGQALGTGNVALIKCPQKTGGAFIDVAAGTSTADCDTTAVSYDLCHLDAYADVWDRPSLTDYAANQKICPHVGHKDLYVEIDYTDDKHKPNPSAIRDVIMAFGNAPVTNVNRDDFNRLGGITLHIIVNEKVTLAAGKAENSPISVWTDSNGIVGDDFDSIKHGTTASLTDGHFGTSAERLDPKKLDMKHYVYRYGLFGHTWGNTCGPSGMGETLGNDFIVTLGCGFGLDGSGHSVGTRAQQAGTLMHELGHTLNLGHGGPAEDLAVGRTNYEMNCKANYLSVMQYTRQFPGLLPSGTSTDKWEYSRDAATGNPLPAKVGTSTWPGTALDYSRSALIDLNENAGLKETTGLPSSPAQKFIYGYKDAVGATRTALGTTGPSVDWNKNNVVSPDTSPVTGDLNSAGITGCPVSAGQLETSKSKSDWASVKLKFLGDPDSLDGAGPDSSASQVSRTQEITGEIFEQMEEQAEASGLTDPPDTTAPNTQINTATDGAGNSVPAGSTTSSNNITFTFSGTDDVAVTDFECSVDSGEFTSCNTPYSIESLQDGSHSFQVRAIDAARNIDATPDSRSWTVDTLKPTVVSTNPVDGATGVAVTSNIIATFSKSMNPSTISTSTFTVNDGATNIAGTVTLSTDGKTATFDPSSVLASSKTYTAKISTGVKDTLGNSMAADKVWTFTTQAQTVVVFNGVDQPINQDGSSIFKIASNVKTIIPVKFLLKDSNGNEITDATVKFTAVKLSSTITGTVNEKTNSGTPTSGDLVKYDTKLKRYVYNWGTINTTQGTWGIRLYLEAPYGSHTLLVGPNNVDNSVKLSLKK